MKACVSPAVIDAVEGLTTMDRRLAMVTVAVVAPAIVPDVADMLEVPAETPVTSPTVLTVATVVSDDSHSRTSKGLGTAIVVSAGGDHLFRAACRDGRSRRRHSDRGQGRIDDETLTANQG
jgi:hypothetical protein